jgi:spore coat-associated protein N
MSRVLILAALALALATALWSRPAPAPAEARVQLVNGTLSMSNAKDGSAILTAAGMAPGDTRVGEVTIANTGSLAGAYALSRSDLRDTPGPAAGTLSTALDLLVQDVTNPGAPATVYSGKLGAMGPSDLGTWGPGAARTYRFTVSLPDGGAPASATTGDNAYQGSAVSVNYDWTATADEPGGDNGGGNGSGGGTGGGNGSGGWTGGGAGRGTGNGGGAGGGWSQTTAPNLTLTGKKRQRVLRQKGLVVIARCSQACSINATAKGTKAARKVKLSGWRGKAKPGARVKIKLRLSKKAKKVAKRALRRGRRATMTVTARASAGAGISTVRRLKVSVR